MVSCLPSITSLAYFIMPPDGCKLTAQIFTLPSVSFIPPPHPHPKIPTSIHLSVPSHTSLSLSSNPLAHCAQLNHDPRFPLFILHVQPSAHSLSLAVASSSLLFHLHDLTPTPTINTTDGQRESTTCRPAHCHIIFASGL